MGPEGTAPPESGTVVAEEDFVILHGRYSGHGLPLNWVVVDIVRLKDGVLVEHWDVIQDEVTQEQSKSGQPMFGRTFATYASAR
jgi:predicted SnoaL-like aldol condensation-catalyzing enzyme